MDDSTFIQFYDNDHHHHIMSKLLYVNFSIMITMYNYEVISFIVLKIGVGVIFFPNSWRRSIGKDPQH